MAVWKDEGQLALAGDSIIAAAADANRRDWTPATSVIFLTAWMTSTTWLPRVVFIKAF